VIWHAAECHIQDIGTPVPLKLYGIMQQTSLKWY